MPRTSLLGVHQLFRSVTTALATKAHHQTALRQTINTIHISYAARNLGGIPERMSCRRSVAVRQAGGSRRSGRLPHRGRPRRARFRAARATHRRSVRSFAQSEVARRPGLTVGPLRRALCRVDRRRRRARIDRPIVIGNSTAAQRRSWSRRGRPCSAWCCADLAAGRVSHRRHLLRAVRTVLQAAHAAHGIRRSRYYRSPAESRKPPRNARIVA